MRRVNEPRVAKGQEAGPTPVSRAPRRPLASRAVKRTMDLVVGGLALPVLLPVFLLIWLAIRLTSRGPSLIRQERLGRERTPFLMFKFRTMRQDADDAVHRAYVASMFNGQARPHNGETGLYKLVHDARVTAVGRFLRRASLDELPQLINVVLGQMSLVGPRPILPWEQDLLGPDDMIRFDVLPGITGLWQVSGRNALTMPQALKIDAEYVRRQSFRLDVTILLKTIPLMISGRGAG